mmetsp:Transcript_709/g.400  ORF Transcript_709/g.400 Transcript_709/m.400 type:complete len:93 (-) Transcript_709:849-1127(-)
MNEAVRESLAEKKKIKDLFLVVLRSIDMSFNKALISSLLSFISNLCYGSNKFKTMLRSENMEEFLGMIGHILKNNDEPDNDGQKDQERVLLK